MKVDIRNKTHKWNQRKFIIINVVGTCWRICLAACILGKDKVVHLHWKCSGIKSHPSDDSFSHVLSHCFFFFFFCWWWVTHSFSLFSFLLHCHELPLKHGSMVKGLDWETKVPGSRLGYNLSSNKKKLWSNLGSAYLWCCRKWGIMWVGKQWSSIWIKHTRDW